MRMTVLAVHIFAGALGLVAGFIALSAEKGAALHRKSGMLFVSAMVSMAVLGTVMAAVWGVAPAANVPIGIMTAYLVITALITVRPAAAVSPRLDLALMLVPLGVSLALLTFGFEAVASANGKKGGMPAPPFFVFAAIGLLAGAGDLRMIRAGGVRAIRGAPRLARHLWRMCVALLIAAFSFFVGQAKVIPKPIRLVPLLIAPPLIVLVALVYWLWRVRIRRRVRGMVGAQVHEAV